jgi:hypothetical protein
MDRRQFLKILLAGGAGAMINRSFGQRIPSIIAPAQALPPVQVNTFSSEIVMNSRRSYHSGYSGTLSDQILANVLWAVSRAPLIGSGRTIYVARPDNVYEYDPQQHEINLHLSGNHMSEGNCAFEVGVASDLAEDAGTALCYSLLAATAFWASSNNQPSSIPKESAYTNANNNWDPVSTIQMVHCHGLMGTVSGITSSCVAHSSNGSLPDPVTDGSVLLEHGLATLPYGDQFASTELTLAELGQVAWASYGNNPHMTSNNRAGLTVASAVANYYLTGRIYIIRSEGVERYHMRLPLGQANTRDHRIERITDGDRRDQLRAAVARLPQNAPNYFVYCATTATRWQLLEAGYGASSALLQTATMDLQGYHTADFTSGERTAIINALGIPSTDLPLLIFSVGQPLVGINEHHSNTSEAVAALPNPFRNSTKIKYSLVTPTMVYVAIHDQAGRLIRVLVNKNESSGNHSVEWDGVGPYYMKEPKGVYYVIAKLGKKEYKNKLIKLN